MKKAASKKQSFAAIVWHFRLCCAWRFAPCAFAVQAGLGLPFPKIAV